MYALSESTMLISGVFNTSYIIFTVLQSYCREIAIRTFKAKQPVMTPLNVLDVEARAAPSSLSAAEVDRD